MSADYVACLRRAQQEAAEAVTETLDAYAEGFVLGLWAAARLYELCGDRRKVQAGREASPVDVHGRTGEAVTVTQSGSRGAVG